MDAIHSFSLMVSSSDQTLHVHDISRVWSGVWLMIDPTEPVPSEPFYYFNNCFPHQNRS